MADTPITAVPTPSKLKGRALFAGQPETAARLRQGLLAYGFACVIADSHRELLQQIAEQSPDVLLLESADLGNGFRETTRVLKQERSLPIIGLTTRNQVGNLDPNLDDFILQPADETELAARIERLLRGNTNAIGETLTAGDLVIDLAKCEVTIAGRRVMLAYQEYELLKFLVSNQGRVFSRQALLDRVWGYDYFGGDRTVDVHVRRLRAKIEDSKHTFIETIRSIGYRFRDQV